MIEEARRWIDTPLRHQGRAPGGARLGIVCDCINLIIETGYGAGVLEPLPRVWEYSHMPDPRMMLGAFSDFMIARPLEAIEPGEVGAFTWGMSPGPIHAGVFAHAHGRLSLIHAYGSTKRQRVLETTYGGALAAQLHSVWRYPGLA